MKSCPGPAGPGPLSFGRACPTELCRSGGQNYTFRSINKMIFFRELITKFHREMRWFCLEKRLGAPLYLRPSGGFIQGLQKEWNLKQGESKIVNHKADSEPEDGGFVVKAVR